MIEFVIIIHSKSYLGFHQTLQERIELLPSDTYVIRAYNPYILTRPDWCFLLN